MVEPWATMLVQNGMGTVVKRTGDLWPHSPGCSLATSSALLERDPELAQCVVNAYVRGAAVVHADPDTAAAAAAPFIGVSAETIREALRCNHPHVDAIRSAQAMDQILSLMGELGYVSNRPEGFADLRFLDVAQRALTAGDSAS